jgi:AcrR family transcriptional regulator
MPLEAFLKLPEKERARILDACVEEFVSRGYEQASTNVMSEKLGIAKGSLFYWFGSKEDLYLHLIDRAGDLFAAAFRDSSREWPAEILARLRVLVEASLAFLDRNRNNYRLYAAFTSGEAKGLLDRYLRDRMPAGMAVWAGWFSGVDASDFRAPLGEVQRLLAWELAGIKMELAAAAAFHEPPADLRCRFLERIDSASRLMAHAIYHHPARWGYS